MTHTGTQTIETERFILRRAEEKDIEAAFRNWMCDDEVTKFLRWGPHRSTEDTKNYISFRMEEYKKQDSYAWFIVPKGTDEPIGEISVVEMKESADCCHVGYCIGKQYWKKGVTSEALTAVIGYLFDKVGAKRIEACHDINNPNSGRVMKHCGMSFEGVLRQADRNNTGICDTAIYSILKEEYENGRANG